MTASPTGASGSSDPTKDHADAAKAAKDDAKSHAKTAADRAGDSVKVISKFMTCRLRSMDFAFVASRTVLWDTGQIIEASKASHVLIKICASD